MVFSYFYDISVKFYVFATVWLVLWLKRRCLILFLLFKIYFIKCAIRSGQIAPYVGQKLDVKNQPRVGGWCSRRVWSVRWVLSCVSTLAPAFFRSEKKKANSMFAKELILIQERHFSRVCFSVYSKSKRDILVFICYPQNTDFHIIFHAKRLFFLSFWSVLRCNFNKGSTNEI